MAQLMSIGPENLPDCIAVCSFGKNKGKVGHWKRIFTVL